MASPQIDDGFTPIANEILEALARVNLSSYQFRVMTVIWRLTYGWGEKSRQIRQVDIVKMTGLTKSHVSRTIKELIERNMIVRAGHNIAFQKDYDRWQKLPIQVTNQPKKVTNSGNKKLPIQVTNQTGKVTNSGNKKLPIQVTPTFEKKERKSLSANADKQPPAARFGSKHFSDHVDSEYLQPLLDESKEIASKVNGSRRFNVHRWLQMQVNARGHPGAMLKALRSLNANWKDVKSPEGYLRSIMRVEDQNFNEADKVKASKLLESEWRNLERSPEAAPVKGLVAGLFNFPDK